VPASLFRDYQAINTALWTAFEQGAVSKDFLKVERYRRTFAIHDLQLDPEAASRLYLDALANTVVLVEGAQALCETLAGIGEIGIITNGIEHQQRSCMRTCPSLRHRKPAATPSRTCASSTTRCAWRAPFRMRKP
jgi:FMN phosphatase YigB (HAD superfamily)